MAVQSAVCLKCFENIFIFIMCLVGVFDSVHATINLTTNRQFPAKARSLLPSSIFSGQSVSRLLNAPSVVSLCRLVSPAFNKIAFALDVLDAGETLSTHIAACGSVPATA
jgi:hypothetical protein